MDPSIFIKVETLRYKGNVVYYRKPILVHMHKATEFNDKYHYYYREKNGENEVFPTHESIGKFVEFSKHWSGNPFDDRDYPVLVFENKTLFDNKINHIYCMGIPDSDENMILVEDMMYEGFPVYYKN